VGRRGLPREVERVMEVKKLGLGLQMSWFIYYR
jgi:hypothetical protein